MIYIRNYLSYYLNFIIKKYSTNKKIMRIIIKNKYSILTTNYKNVILILIKCF